MSDNGGEFSNATYSEMCNAFNIEEGKTAAESPWSNGMVERHNQIIKESVRKTLEDTNTSIETAVVWAISAKNSLSGSNGFTPNILVFGRNPNTPTVLSSELPALEKASTETVRDNLNAMHAARKAFIQKESSEKIKRALRHNVRTCNDSIYKNGEKVYFQRNNGNK